MFGNIGNIGGVRGKNKERLKKLKLSEMPVNDECRGSELNASATSMVATVYVSVFYNYPLFIQPASYINKFLYQYSLFQKNFNILQKFFSIRKHMGSDKFVNSQLVTE